MENIKVSLEITNSDEILATAERLREIAKELSAIGYRLQGKYEVKKGATNSQ